MQPITISPDKKYFFRGGKPFFYVADTAWMAFSNISLQDWSRYLDVRAEQGFTVLQISVLPVLHDNSISTDSIFGFEMENGKPDYDKINDEYFNRAEEMVRMATEKGFVAALAPVWCNFISGTWAAKSLSEKYSMSFQQIKAYVEYVVRRFKPYHPIYLASGDTRFETTEIIETYLMILDTIKKNDADALTTLHLGVTDVMPDVLADSPQLDLYMFQSGHHLESQSNTYLFARSFSGYKVKRPVINGEPCYDGCGHGHRLERFNTFEVRRAIWQSLLAGASAGIGYGSHGIWSFHTRDMSFTSEPFSGRPYVWETALGLPGAWDATFARWIFETYNLFGISPVNVASDAGFAAAKDNALAIYLPYDFDFTIPGEYADYDYFTIILEDKKVARPTVIVNGGQTTFKMHSFNSDVLIIGVRK